MPADSDVDYFVLKSQRLIKLIKKNEPVLRPQNAKLKQARDSDEIETLMHTPLRNPSKHSLEDEFSVERLRAVPFFHERLAAP